MMFTYATKSASYPVVLKAKAAFWLPERRMLPNEKWEESREMSYSRKRISRAFSDIYVDNSISEALSIGE